MTHVCSDMAGNPQSDPGNPTDQSKKMFATLRMKIGLLCHDKWQVGPERGPNVTGKKLCQNKN